MKAFIMPSWARIWITIPPPPPDPCEADTIKALEYLDVACSYRQVFAPYYEKTQRENRDDTVHNITDHGHNVLVRHQWIQMDDSPRAPLFIALYPRNSDWMKASMLVYKEADPSKPRYKNEIDQKWHDIAMAYNLQESVVWATIHNEENEDEVWDLSCSVYIIQLAIHYLKTRPEVDINRFYLIGDGPGGDFVLNEAGPRLRHYLAGVGATNCSAISPHLRLHYINFPCFFHMSPTAENVDYSPNIAQDSLFPQKYKDYVELLPHMVTISAANELNNALKEVYRRLAKPEGNNQKWGKRIANPDFLCWYQQERSTRVYNNWEQWNTNWTRHYWLALPTSFVEGDFLMIGRHVSDTRFEVEVKGVNELCFYCAEPFFNIAVPIAFILNNVLFRGDFSAARLPQIPPLTVSYSWDPCLVYSSVIKFTLLGKGKLDVTYVNP